LGAFVILVPDASASAYRTHHLVADEDGKPTRLGKIAHPLRGAVDLFVHALVELARCAAKLGGEL